MEYCLERLIDVALKRCKASKVLKNCRIINVFSGEIESGDVAIEGGYIAGIGRFSGTEEIDLGGKFLCPGFIDAHVHIESSMVTPSKFAGLVLPRGTTAVVADPHEIANVLGIRGIEYMLEASRDIPLYVYIMIPSCVPATPFETSGAVLSAGDIGQLLGRDRVLGLGELMNCPGVMAKDPEVMEKIRVSDGYIIDGHGAGLSPEQLGAYRLAGAYTDHECTTQEEALWRIRAGMYVAIREGTAARNLDRLLGAVNNANWWQFMFCTDDRHLGDILEEGHIDHCIRKAIGRGMDPITAVRLATINPARCYNLKGQGAIAPGYLANLVVVDSLEHFNVEKVFAKGDLVADSGEMLVQLEDRCSVKFMDNTINMAPIKDDIFKVKGNNVKVPVIKVIPGSIETGWEYREIEQQGDYLVPPVDKDILKIAVVERHKATGNVGVGFIEGFGFKGGAIASSVAHDSHNIIVIGDRDDAMLEAVVKLKETGGGFCLVDARRDPKEILWLSLPVAGLLSPYGVEEVEERLSMLLQRAREMGIREGVDPFITLSFMALPVIPSLKITDKGLFDVNSFQFIHQAP